MLVVVLFIIIVLLCLPYLVDVIVNGSTFVKRLKIGRWDDLNLWDNAICSVSKKWIIRAPTVKKNDNSKLILFDMLKGNYRNNTIQSWQTGLVYLASIERENKHYWDRFINEDGKWKLIPDEIDYSLLAYAILKDCDDKEKIKIAMDEMYQLIIKRIGEDGCICYRDYCKEDRYVDTVGFVSPFLALYGITYDCKGARKLAVKVITEYYSNGFHKDLFLPIHAYNSKTLCPLGIYGWGRGVGWFLLGITDAYIILKDEKLKSIILELSEKYMDYQRDDGSFSSIVQLKQNPESSSTSVFAYFYAVCAEIFDSYKYFEIANNAVHYLMKITRRNGEIDFSQGDTKGIGFYSLTSDIMPFTQGMACRASYIIKRMVKKYE